MDFEDQADEEEGLPKWPFLASALFILSGALGFAYYHHHISGQLEVWQLLVCILASGTASLLIFMPFLLERSLQLCLLTANRKDDELFRKVYFDLKEVRNELEALAVKIDKVPTLVDKIVSDSTKGPSQLDQLSAELSENKEEITHKLARLEELASQEPIPFEPDPGIAQANQSISDLSRSTKELSKQLQDMQSRVNQLPTEFPEPVIQTVEVREEPLPKEPEVLPEEVKDIAADEVLSEEQGIPTGEILTDDASPPEPSPTETEEASSDEELPDLNPPESSEIDQPATDELAIEDSEPSGEDTLSIVEEPAPTGQEKDKDENNDTLLEEKLEEEVFDDLELADDEIDPAHTPEEIALTSEDEDQNLEDKELDLGLPDPAETLRKVDALLAGESTSPTKEVSKDPPKPKSNGGVTSVIANVMIGIGNKPYVRGEGPGLSWEEGAPMNFLEIGKWAWSPPRKNATVTIQIYRNDEDPDSTGKHEIKAGEKFEITPDFS